MTTVTTSIDVDVPVQVDGEPEGLVEKVGSAFDVDDNQVKADLTRFKAFIEEQGAATGAWRGDVPAGDES